MHRSVRTISVVAASAVLACSDPTAGDSAEGVAFTAYSETGGRTLIQFLEEWQAEVRPITPGELATKSAAVQEVYSLFAAYWNPLDLTRYTSGISNKPRYTLYDDQDYLVVQAKVRYRTGGCNPFDRQCGPYINVDDFRPTIQVFGKKILYETTKFTGPIERYINAGATDQGIEARTTFVAASLGIMYITCGTCWTFSSAPLVTAIDFSSDFSRAKVYVWLGYSTYESTLDKINGTWRITASRYDGILD